MKLYSVTIRGIKFYFEAQISDEQYKLVDKMCETIQEESQKYCAEDIFSLFTNTYQTYQEPTQASDSVLSIYPHDI